MFASERLLARLSRIRKENWQISAEEIESSVRQSFTGLLSGLPPGMPDEVFGQFWETVIRRNDDQPAVDRARYLADVVDLFCGQYDTDNDPLHPDDWEIVADLVNDFAMEMDMKAVTEIMALVVDHRGV